MLNYIKKYQNTMYFLLSTGIGVNIFYKSLYIVEPGFFSIKFNIFNGVGSRVYKEGYHLLIPYVERPIIYDCRMKNYLQNCICGTQDLQKVTLKTRIICKPRIDKLPDLYRLLGINYDERVLYSVIPEICSVAISQFNASKIISQRDLISQIIKHKITEKAKEFYIDVDDVAIIDIHFSPEFSLAIEQKQVAQQEAERTKILVEQALEEKKATIIRVLGETESVKKFGIANQSSEAYLNLRRLETSKKISKLLSGKNNKIILDPNLFYLNFDMKK